MRFIGLGHHAVDENEPAVRLHAVANVSQDRVGFFVVPVMNDPLRPIPQRSLDLMSAGRECLVCQ
jgi:hypothetical protein